MIANESTTTPSGSAPASIVQRGRNYALAALAVIAIALIGAPLLGHLDLANIAMLFPLAVLGEISFVLGKGVLWRIMTNREIKS